MKLFYPVIFTKEDVGYSAVAADLDGCFSEGDTFGEAYTNIQDAIGLYLEDLEEYPAPSNPESISHDLGDGKFMCVVEFDQTEYKKRNYTKSVKKTLTIPEWLNEEAEKQHINFSGVLQDALKSKLDIV